MQTNIPYDSTNSLLYHVWVNSQHCTTVDPITGERFTEPAAALQGVHTFISDLRLGHSESILAERERDESGDVEAGYYPVDRPKVTHTKDTDCTVDPLTDCCFHCGVYHGDPCPACGGRGFHVEGCKGQEAV